jgi:hypothetical protein
VLVASRATECAPLHCASRESQAGFSLGPIRRSLRNSMQCLRVQLGHIPFTRTLSTSTKAVTLADRHSPLLDLSRLPAEALPPLSISPNDFQLFPHFFDAAASQELLTACLAKLDRSSNSTEDRAARKAYRKNAMASADALFLDESAYHFQEGHFDAVFA